MTRVSLVFTLLAAGALGIARWSASLRTGAPGAGLAEPLWLAGLVLGVPALLVLVASLLHRRARPAPEPPRVPVVQRPAVQEAAHIKLVREALDAARREAMRRVKRDDVRQSRRRADK